MVAFSKANAKLEALYDVPELSSWLTDKRKVYSFDLLSGYSCPFARECMSKVVEINGKRTIQDGKETQFRCFSASQEVVFPSAYNKRKANFDALRSLHLNDMIHELNTALPKNAGIVRIHVAGDFFSPAYMFAWINVAMLNPNTLFYAYTKSLSYWLRYDEYISQIDNFVLTASRGGRQDHLIDQHNLRESKVVFSEAEAEALGYEIDHTDEHAAIPALRAESFALLIHGVQPAGSAASQAIKELKKSNVKFSYNKKKKG
jgi:hypothetical protein